MTQGVLAGGCDMARAGKARQLQKQGGDCRTLAGGYIEVLD